ncbi:MAG: lipopolysaccharide kinase InaA family protein [Candidatus Thermoplasmatota archaeon]
MEVDDDGEMFCPEEIYSLTQESLFESPFFKKEENNSYGHFSSVIKEIKDGNDGVHLVKIRPLFFYLSGVLSNISRVLSGSGTRKILDNRRWRRREISCMQAIHPELKINATPYLNSILVEKIHGKVVYDVLRDDKLVDDVKKDVIIKMAEGLKEIHDKDLYHGEPNTQNCILSDDDDELYWIDFEIEYFEHLSLKEKKAKDLEQLILSVLGAFEEENTINMDDFEIIDLIFNRYNDDEIKNVFLKTHTLPSITPLRVYQLSFSSTLRFYECQLKLLEYIDKKHGI